MNQLTSLSPIVHQRAKGHLAISAVHADGATRLGRVRQESSFRLLFPKTHYGDVEAVMLNTSGGITGGDRFAVDVHAGARAHLTMTTQAAERVYQALYGQMGQVDVTLKADAGARLRWLPQETILFNGCGLRRRLTVDLDEGAEFLMVEPLVFGRRASGEVVSQGVLDDAVLIRQKGQTVYRDAVRLNGDLKAHLQRPAVAGGCTAMASLVFCSERAEAVLDEVRALLPSTAGASLLAPGILVLRALAEDSFALRQSLMPVLTFLTQDALPKTWRL